MLCRSFYRIITVLIAILFLGACGAATSTNEIADSNTATPAVTTTSVPTSTPTEPAENFSFPPGINPLTGQPASDPKLLKTPAMLVSISHFPALGRPQAGLSFAPYVFEFYITEGATRFLTAFYGQFPHPEIPVTGNCEIRKDPFTQTDTILGNRVWLDVNRNGTLDPDEQGIAGVCVDLLDASGNLMQSTTTDTNGYYGFNMQNGQSYTIEIQRPPTMEFTQMNAGDNKLDSDFDPAAGKTQIISITGDDLQEDAGLILSKSAPTPDPSYLPPAKVGPVRSGRLLYAHIGAFFQSSCLVYAFASPEVLAKIPQCFFVQHQFEGGGYMLDIDQMQKIALENKRKTGDIDFNYVSNQYSDLPPEGGKDASRIDVYISYLNQSGWIYDPLYQSWLRYVDTSEESLAGVLFPDTDRLNRRQLHFENIIVLYAKHEVISPTNLDIHLEAGLQGNAFLFRDSRVYPILWSTQPGKYEEETGLRRPIQFLNKDKTLAPLKPGHTWAIIVTEQSTLLEETLGRWKVHFIAPAGAQ